MAEQLRALLEAVTSRPDERILARVAGDPLGGRGVAPPGPAARAERRPRAGGIPPSDRTILGGLHPQRVTSTRAAGGGRRSRVFDVRAARSVGQSGRRGPLEHGGEGRRLCRHLRPSLRLPRSRDPGCVEDGRRVLLAGLRLPAGAPGRSAHAGPATCVDSSCRVALRHHPQLRATVAASVAQAQLQLPAALTPKWRVELSSEPCRRSRFGRTASPTSSSPPGRRASPRPSRRHTSRSSTSLAGTKDIRALARRPVQHAVGDWSRSAAARHLHAVVVRWHPLRPRCGTIRGARVLGRLGRRGAHQRRAHDALHQRAADEDGVGRRQAPLAEVRVLRGRSTADAACPRA